MSRAVHADPLEAYLDRSWPPMRHIAAGANRLDEAGRERVARRVAGLVSAFKPPAEKRAPLRRLFSFLSQVEVIAIEVPLAALPSASDEMRPLFERQLEDEVFHSLVFAELARSLGGLDAPVPEAERLLDQIRTQADPKTTAVLLNAIAEGWIENLFEHAATWGVADEVFGVVLADEARHVEEAMLHADGVDATHVEGAVRRFEEDLFRLAQHPRVLLPVLASAGERAFQELSLSFVNVHKRALQTVGLEPDPAFSQLEQLGDAGDASAEADAAEAGPFLRDALRPTRIEPESQWRRTALEIWDAPRNPVMLGWFDVRVDHIPHRLLTAMMVAAVGKVWAEYPRMNRYTWAGELWEPAQVNVGVRVALGDSGEALSTIVVPSADERSVDDIRRIIDAGLARMNEFGEEAERIVPDPEAEALSTVLRDGELMAMVPPETVTCPVTVSNVGRAGLQGGFGAMPGALGQSVEFAMGRIDKRPHWNGWRYKPADTVTIGAGADHRVVDGPHCAEAMRRIADALSPEGARELLLRPDTLGPDEDVQAAIEEATGFTTEQGRIMMSCKLPVWLGWLCWMFKK